MGVGVTIGSSALGVGDVVGGGVAVGVIVGVGLGDGVGRGVGLTVGDDVGGGGVGLAVGTGVGDGVGVGVASHGRGLLTSSPWAACRALTLTEIVMVRTPRWQMVIRPKGVSGGDGGTGVGDVVGTTVGAGVGDGVGLAVGTGVGEGVGVGVTVEPANAWVANPSARPKTTIAPSRLNRFITTPSADLFCRLLANFCGSPSNSANLEHCLISGNSLYARTGVAFYPSGTRIDAKKTNV